MKCFNDSLLYLELIKLLWSYVTVFIRCKGKVFPVFN